MILKFYNILGDEDIFYEMLNKIHLYINSVKWWFPISICLTSNMQQQQKQGYFTLVINSNFVRFELGWIGLNWVELGWIGLNSVEFGWIGLNWVTLGWIGLIGFLFVGVSLTTFVFGPNLLVRIKLGYTPNFAALVINSNFVRFELG